MTKLQKIFVVFAAMVIAVSIFLGVSELSADTAPVLLRFAEGHASVLQGGTLCLVLFAVFTLIAVAFRRRRR